VQRGQHPQAVREPEHRRADANFGAEAGRLLGETGRADTIDALVATTAIRLWRPVTILTSDPDDLRALSAGHPAVNVVAI
jgi:hypothetical protein